MKYYTLISKINGQWFPQFGDYDRSVVKDEKEDSYSDQVCEVIVTEDNQPSIDYKIAQLNAGK